MCIRDRVNSLPFAQLLPNTTETADFTNTVWSPGGFARCVNSPFHAGALSLDGAYLSYSGKQTFHGWTLADRGNVRDYSRLFSTVGFGANLLDSFIVAGGTVIFGLTLSLPAAYAFSRFRFKGRRFLMLQFLVINMFPLVLLILPLFILMKSLAWIIHENAQFSLCLLYTSTLPTTPYV